MRALRSPLFSGHGFRHGFSLRTGGVSAGPFASLNLGRAVGDDPEAVAENHRLFAEAVGYAPQSLYEVTQVHGAAVARVSAARVPPELLPAAFREREADAIVSTCAERAIGVRVADCVPVLLADPVSGAVAAVHAGWRGAVAGVVEAGVAALSEAAGAPRDRLIAAVFPCISQAAFEVGEDVAAQLASAVEGASVVRRATGQRPHVDLAGAVIALLARAGIVGARLEHVPGCTAGEPLRFFSHRRDAGKTGRHLAAIVPRC